MDDSIPTGAICGPDGCPEGRDEGATAAAMPTEAGAGTRIDVVSDAICPWCYIGKRQLERALDRDNFMTAEEAKDWGLIDRVITTRAENEGGDE